MYAGLPGAWGWRIAISNFLAPGALEAGVQVHERWGLMWTCCSGYLEPRDSSLYSEHQKNACTLSHGCLESRRPGRPCMDLGLQGLSTRLAIMLETIMATLGHNNSNSKVLTPCKLEFNSKKSMYPMAFRASHTATLVLHRWLAGERQIEQ